MPEDEPTRPLPADVFTPLRLLYYTGSVPSDLSLGAPCWRFFVSVKDPDWRIAMAGCGAEGAPHARGTLCLWNSRRTDIIAVVGPLDVCRKVLHGLFL